MEQIRITIRSGSEEATLTLGEALGRIAQPGDLLALHGDLGAGKTRLVRGIARGMGIDPAAVSSPTFVIAHEYTPTPDSPPVANSSPTAAPSQDRPPLIHIDAYRLTGPDELDTIGWDRITDGSAVVAIEWAERIADLLPTGERRADITLHATGADQREVEVLAPLAWTRREGWAELARGAAATDQGPSTTARTARSRREPLPRGWARCPITGKPVPPDSPTFPFFDEKSRMADLGRWFSGGYSVSRDLVEEDLDDPDLTSRA